MLKRVGKCGLQSAWKYLFISNRGSTSLSSHIIFILVPNIFRCPYETPNFGKRRLRCRRFILATIFICSHKSLFTFIVLLVPFLLCETNTILYVNLSNTYPKLIEGLIELFLFWFSMAKSIQQKPDKYILMST